MAGFAPAPSLLLLFALRFASPEPRWRTFPSAIGRAAVHDLVIPSGDWA